VTGIQYPDTLEKLPMQICMGNFSKDSVLMPRYSAHRSASSLSYYNMDWIERFHANGLPQATLTLSHLLPLSLHHLFLLGLHKWCFLHSALPELLGRYDLLQLFKPSMNTNVWTELDYTRDVSRATQGAVTVNLQTVK